MSKKIGEITITFDIIEADAAVVGTPRFDVLGIANPMVIDSDLTDRQLDFLDEDIAVTGIDNETVQAVIAAIKAARNNTIDV